MKKHKYIVLEKAQVRVKPYQRKGRYVIGYNRESREAEAKADIRQRMGMRADFEMGEYYPVRQYYGEPYRVKGSKNVKPMTSEDKLKWAHRKEHYDVGVKVGGAKKDIWAAITASNLGQLESLGVKEAYDKVVKTSVFQEPNWELEQQNGVTAGTAYMKKALIRSIASRPPDSQEMRQAYVEGAGLIIESLAKIKTRTELFDMIEEFNMMRKKLKPDRVLSSEEFHEMGKELPSNSLSISYYKEVFKKLYPDDPKIQAEAQAEISADRKFYRIFIPSNDTAWEKYSQAFGPSFISLLERRQHASKYQGLPASSFWTKTYKEAYLKDKNSDWSWAIGDGIGKVKEKRFEWTRRVDKTVSRDGGDVAPPNTKADNLLNSFNLRAVEYGNWISDDDAKYHIQHSWEAFSDLTDILGLEKQDASLKGKLALAIGARGAGKALAHYETMKKIINLTKFNGGGCIAHEFAHALDNIMGEASLQEEKGSHFYLSSGMMAGSPPGGWKEADKVGWKDTKLQDTKLQETFNELMKTIKYGALSANERQVEKQKLMDEINQKRKDYYATSKENKENREKARLELNAVVKEYNKMAVKKQTKYYTGAQIMGTYWADSKELFARAFESYVQDKLTDNGRKNTYLVSGTRVPYGTKVISKGIERPVEPYPQGEERKAINLAIENLMVVVRSSDSLKKALVSLFG